MTGQYDVLRDGYNPNEATINQTNVVNLTNTRVMVVDTEDLPSGQYANPIYAQPLYVPSVTIASASHSLLVGATLNGSVFAWDADNPSCDSSSPPNCHPIWSREGNSSASNPLLNSVGYALAWADCGPGSQPVPLATSLPYLGIVSTPAIDAHSTSADPLIFLTSACEDSGGGRHWYLHEIDLTTGLDMDATEINGFSSAGADSADDIELSGQIPFRPAEVLQRPAILEVTGGNPSTLVYLAFGTAVQENSSANPYHGWLLAYSVDSSGHFNYCNGSSLPACPAVTFVTTPTGSPTNTGTPACDTSQTVGGSGEYQNQPNWCGHGAGIWMSGRGPVAASMGGGNTDILVGVGNGGFQNQPNTGNPQNWGESILAFGYHPSAAPDQTPGQYFAPYGGTAISPPLADSECSGSVSCAYTFEVLNENDWDMAVSGILPFTDLSSHNRAVVFDKGGWGYVLPTSCLQGFSGGSCAAATNGFQSGDPANQFHFYGPETYCPSGSGPQNSNECDRITSMVLYGDSTDGEYLYIWPSGERLSALQLTSGTSVSGSGTITSSGTTVTISSGGDFSTMVVAGDTITDTNASSPDYNEQRTVTLVTGTPPVTSLTIASAFSTNITGGDSFSYSGYFATPIRDAHPSTVGYPGGSLIASSDAGASGSGLIWALTQASGSSQVTRTAGTLRAYLPAVIGGSDVQERWDSSEIFCGASFALPTVVDGQVFVPTYAINLAGTAATACPSSSTTTAYPSGILVYKP